MLGLLNDREKTTWNVVPDYTRQTEQIYKEVSVSYMRIFHSLDFLRFCDLGHRNSEHDLPTWVPDWSCMENLPLPTALNYADADVRGEFRRSEYNGRGLLHVKGVQLGKIEEAHKFTHKDQGVDYSSEAKLLQRIIDLAFRILSRTDVDDATFLHAICRTIFMNGFRDNWDPPIAYGATIEESKTLLAKVLATQDSEDELLSDSGMNSFLGRMYPYRGRSFIATRDGNIGLAPRATKASDRVCILPGCGTPLVVRPTGSDSTQYQVVGPCYIDGMMTGEAFLGPMPDHFRMLSKLDRESQLEEMAFYDERSSKIQWEDPRWQLVLGEDYKERFAITNVRSSKQRQKLADEVMRARKIETVWMDFV